MGAPEAMTLSADEYHDHLKTTAVRAGFSFDEVVLPEEHRVAANGLGFRYLDWGTKGQRPILFLHGGALTAHTWDLCCLALRDEFHCIALDQRGHGDTDWAPDADYSNARMSGALSMNSVSTGLSSSACRWAQSMRSPLQSTMRRNSLRWC
jgi:hypothetical protein